MNAEQRNALLEIMDDRYGNTDDSGQSACQLKSGTRAWVTNTLADAILDRLMQ